MTACWARNMAETKGSSGYRWVLDPVDGTRAFITGRHEWGSLIALENDGVPVLGILDQPVLGERFVGVNGEAHLVQAGKASPLEVRACASLVGRDPVRHRSRRLFLQGTACRLRACGPHHQNDPLWRRLLSVRGAGAGFRRSS